MVGAAGAAEQALQQADQHGSLVGGQSGEHLFLRGGQDAVEFAQPGQPLVGDGDDVPAPVVGVGGPPYESCVRQFADCGGDVAAVHLGVAAQADLAGRAELGQCRQHPDVVSARAGRAEPRGYHRVRVRRDLADHPGRLAGQQGGRGPVSRSHGHSLNRTCWQRQLMICWCCQRWRSQQKSWEEPCQQLLTRA